MEQILQCVLERLDTWHVVTLDDVPVENGIDILLEHGGSHAGGHVLDIGEPAALHVVRHCPAKKPLLPCGEPRGRNFLKDPVEAQILRKGEREHLDWERAAAHLGGYFLRKQP